MFDKLFGRNKSNDIIRNDPKILFGHYSDNNKSADKINRWTDADNLFKEGKYLESIDAFFEYLRDEEVGNVIYERNENEGKFEIYQGSKIVKGTFSENLINAEVSLALMTHPSVPVMRKLLEMNYGLYYSRYAMDAERLCMRFDSTINVASPSKLYYGFKELATKADKQDDLLLESFGNLQAWGRDHVIEIPTEQKEIKYEYLQKWIQQTLNKVASVDADKFSGGISYLLLSLIFRIDYLLAPEGKLLNELERISGIYFTKDEKPILEKTRNMVEAFKNLAAMTKEEFFKCLYTSKHTFAIVAPQQYKIIKDSIEKANNNMIWYRDNNYPQFASQIIEYGISYCQYTFSLPKAITEYFHLFMMINYSEYFRSMGYKNLFFNPDQNEFAKEEIIKSINEIQVRWKERFPLMNFKIDTLKFDNLVNFNDSFTTELMNLNTEAK